MICFVGGIKYFPREVRRLHRYCKCRSWTFTALCHGAMSRYVPWVSGLVFEMSRSGHGRNRQSRSIGKLRCSADGEEDDDAKEVINFCSENLSWRD